ncbi:hypothetical protein [Synechococcus sp. CCY 9618]|uniref:hypothetical protein n=1 Tax=Synechococcus sp. CCY 9618 TaxID=2815602 RepID=UPI001C2150D1|nr:hypothetical protein [Synechococcus sp. CCY 9618]
MNKLIIVLLWDAYYRPHLAANLAFLKTLAVENEQIIVLTCPTYYQEKHHILSQVTFDQMKGEPRLSRRKRIYYSFRHVVNQITAPSRATLPSLLKHYPQIQFISAYALVAKGFLSTIREQVELADLTEILEKELYGTKLASHWSVDLSLDCKTLLDDICANTPQDAILRSLAFHSLLVLEALRCFFQRHKNTPIQFISTSVYSLDWLSRQFILDHGCRHVFVQMLSNGAQPSCKIYRSVPEDLFLRRQVQACCASDYALLPASIQYAEKYIHARLSLSSNHTYSPLKTEAGDLAALFAGSQIASGRPLWIYYTNSPDELVSIAHAYRSSGMSGLIPWYDSGFLRDEVEALTIITQLAHKLNACLVVRQHPRLWCEQRSQFVSSTYAFLSRVLQEQQLKYPGVITIVEPWERVNSYELAIIGDKVISFRGTMALEVSLLGIKPIVLARDKGIMNYWIKDHAEAAPKTIADLEQLLTNDAASVYALHELCSYLIQFYLLNQYGTVELHSDSISAKSLSLALEVGSSIPSKHNGPLSSSAPIIRSADQMIDSYFLQLYNNLATSFL